MKDIVEQARRRLLYIEDDGEAVLIDVMATKIERLRAALREIVDCPQKRHRADGEVEVYYNAATMLKIAREALDE